MPDGEVLETVLVADMFIDLPGLRVRAMTPTLPLSFRGPLLQTDVKHLKISPLYPISNVGPIPNPRPCLPLPPTHCTRLGDFFADCPLLPMS